MSAQEKGELSSIAYIRVACSDDTPIGRYKIALTRGKGRSFFPRFMKSDKSRVAYNLYIDPGRSIIWGNGRKGSVLQGVGPCTELAPCTHVIYGKANILSKQKIKSGEFQDRVRVVLYHD